MSYWTGAIVDALAAIQMLFPGVFAFTNRLAAFYPGKDYAYATGAGASLMLGWTLLLIWADQKPLERSAILILTVFPVITGLVLAEIAAVRSEFFAVKAMVAIWGLQAALTVLFTYSYLIARRVRSPAA